MSRFAIGLAVSLAVLFLVSAGAGTLEAAEVKRRTILAGTRFATELIEIDSGRQGPTVWISGGVHGSELAGWKAAERIAGWRISRGTLIVVPHANQPAVAQQRRSATGDADLNRQFPKSGGQQPQGVLAKALWAELKRYDPDWVFDLHEALGNRNLQKNSVGQTIIVHPARSMPSLALRVVRRINQELPASKDFRVLRNPVKGSLAGAAGQFLGANAAIVETSRMYPLEDRIDWHLRIMRLVLEELNLQPQTASRDVQAETAADGFRRTAA